MRFYYSDSTLQEEKSQQSFYRFLLILNDILLVAAFVLLFCFLSRQNQAWFLSLLFVIAVLFVVLNVYLLTYRLVPLRKRIAFEEQIRKEEKQTIEGKALSIGEPLTAPSGLKMRNITFLEGETKRALWLDAAVTFPLSEGESGHLIIADNIIVGDESEEAALPYGHPYGGMGNHLARFWPVYIAGFAVVISLTVWGRNMRLAVKSSEKLSCFFISYNLDETAFRNDLIAQNPSLLEVEVVRYAPTTPYLNTIISANGMVDTDLLIMPEGTLSDSDVSRGTKSFDWSLFASSCPTSSAYTIDEKCYGIRFHQKGETNHLRIDSYLSYGEGENEADYILYFNPSSVNLGAMKEGSETRNAISATTWLLEAIA